MTWVNPPIVATGDFITAALWNTYIRANGLHLRGLLPDASGASVALIATSTTGAAFGLIPQAVMAATERLPTSMMMDWTGSAGSIPTGWSQNGSAIGRHVKGIDGTNYTSVGQIGGGDAQNNQHGHGAAHSHSTTSVGVTGSSSSVSVTGSSSSVSVTGSCSVTSGATGGPTGTDNANTSTGAGTHGDATSAHTHGTISGSGSISGTAAAGTISGTAAAGTISGTAAAGTASTNTGYVTDNALGTMDNRSAWYAAYHIVKSSST